MSNQVYQADLVVVGGGAAGMPAALEALEQGVKRVILMDKRPFPGGNARMAGGFVFACDAYTHEKAGVEFHAEDVYKHTMNFHHYDGINPRVLWAFLSRSADNLNWLRSKGIEYEYNPMMGNGIVGAGAPGSYAKVLDRLKSEFLEKGGVLLTNAPAKELLLDQSGKICGVLGESKESGAIHIEAPYVFLATGGFLGDEGLMQKYFSDQYAPQACVTDALKLTGDGIHMAQRAGALLAPKATLAKESGFSFAHHNAPHRISMYEGALWVNQDGVRFCDESTAAEHINANLLVMQPGMYGYSIMDEWMMQDLIQHPSPRINNEFLQPGDPKVKQQLLQLAKQLPDQCFIADSLDEIAGWLGVKPAVLQQTVDTYNAACAAGHDGEFFKPAAQLKPLKTPPYYVCRFSPLMIETIGPVVVNHHFQVLRASDRKPLPGLYAGGAITSGWQGHDYELWGANLGYGLSSGRIAADHIAANLR